MKKFTKKPIISKYLSIQLKAGFILILLLNFGNFYTKKIKNKEKLGKLGLKDKNLRILETRQWSNLNLEFDISDLSSQEWKTSNLNMQILVAQQILETIKTHLNTYSQTYSQSSINLSGGSCNGVDLPIKKISSNFYIIIKGIDDWSSNKMVKGYQCIFDTITGKPNIGLIEINFRKIKVEKIYRKIIYSNFLHEIFHVMGFDQNNFSKFLDDDKNVRNSDSMISSINDGDVTYTTVIMKNALDYAKEFYSCASLEGLRLENENLPSENFQTHWELTYFADDIMNPQLDLNNKLSQLTLLVMQFSNWYRFNTQMSEPVFWGKNKGCDFFNGCPTSSEFCIEKGKLSCSEDFSSRTICQENANSICLLNLPTLESSCIFGQFRSEDDRNLEKIGPGSSCFISSFNNKPNKASCFSSNCVDGKIEIYLGNDSTKICESNGQEVIQGDVKIICPNIQKFCDARNSRCPKDCSNQGICLINNRCLCYSGWRGNDCSQGSDVLNSGKNTTKNGTDSDDPTSPSNSSESSNSESDSDYLRPLLVLLVAIAFIIIIILIVYIPCPGSSSKSNKKNTNKKLEEEQDSKSQRYRNDSNSQSNPSWTPSNSFSGQSYSNSDVYANGYNSQIKNTPSFHYDQSLISNNDFYSIKSLNSADRYYDSTFPIQPYNIYDDRQNHY